MEQQVRETLLFHFLKAYKEGNLALCGAIFHQGETDPELSKLLWTSFLSYIQDEEKIQPASDEEKETFLSQIIHQPLPKDQSTDRFPLIIAEVAAELSIDILVHPAAYPEAVAIQKVLDPLVQIYEPLPGPLDASTIERMVSDLSVPIPSGFLDRFLEMADRLQARYTGQYHERSFS